MSLFSFHASTQGCSEASLLQTAGNWKEGMKGSYSVTGANLQKEIKVLAAIHTMVKSKYAPTGVEALFHGARSSPSPDRPANGYAYSIIPLNYHCEGNSIKPDHESSTYFQIQVNEFGAAIYDTAQGDRSSMEGYNVIQDMPVEQDGHFYFREKDVTLAFGVPGKLSEWLITYDGKLPYAYVTKKEFLEKRKRNLANQMLSSAAGVRDVLARLEMEKGFKETEYKNDPAKLKKYMTMDYLQIKARYEKQLAENEKRHQPAFTKLETQLKMAPGDLNRPAVVKMDPQDHLSYLFTDDIDPFGKVLIKPNPAYFNKQLPKSSPQFFSIFITGSHKDRIAAKFMTDIMKSVDFAALKTMLGK